MPDPRDPWAPPLPSNAELQANADAVRAAMADILDACVHARILIADPVNILAVQMLGPLLARALGQDPYTVMHNVTCACEMISQAQIDQIFGFIREAQRGN